MIDGIRRRLSKPASKDPWDADQELQPEEVASELPTDAAVFLAARSVSPGYSPEDGDSNAYYRGIVRTAIENGGRYGDHKIPIPWLRMILAGLESRYIDPETMWYEVEEGPVAQIPEIPSYEDLFPSEREVPAVTR